MGSKFTQRRSNQMQYGHKAKMFVPKHKTQGLKSYQILNFGYQGAFQQIILIYPDQDSYAQEITSRIVNSVELNTAKK